MKYQLFGLVLAGALSTAVVAAQNPPQSAPSQPQSPRPTPTERPTSQKSSLQNADRAAVTVEGCLMREADVPGRQPSPVERAGLGEDYLLTDAKVIKGTAPVGSDSPERAGAPGQINPPAGSNRPSDRGASASIAMYDVEGLPADQLKANLGKRVQIDGSFSNLDRASAPASPNADLVVLRASAIRSTTGTCPTSSAQ